jgi:hypothetical protein
MDKLIAYVKTNRVALSSAIRIFEKDPARIRNIIAEQGTEVTTVQLRQLVDMITEILDNME